MSTQQLLHPTEELALSYVRQFEQNSKLASTDEALFKLFHTFPRNQNVDEVYAKVSLLNLWYYTQIYATFDLAKHICKLGIDDDLRRGSLDVVGRIAWMAINGNMRNNYSFASKYCSFHFPDVYPIYDRYVDNLLWAYQKADSFSSPFYRYELQDYSKYRTVINNFRNYYGLVSLSLKKVDKFLWLYGKELFA